MRGLLIAAALLCSVQADAEDLQAGVAQLAADGASPDIRIWYPAEPDDEPAAGRFPIVLLSHGGGLGGGSPLILSGLAVDLARHGFIVAAPFHGKTALRQRTFQIGLALAAARADPRFGPHIDPARLGMLGFSLGGAVTLELAGARPDPGRLAAYCDGHADDVMSCAHAPAASLGERPAPVSPLPLKSIVLLDPFAALFGRDGLAAVTLPVLLVRPMQSALPGDGNAFALAAALPHPPRLMQIPGGHFVFTDLCNPVKQAAAPEICEDLPGVDRTAIQADLEAQIVQFFRKTL